MTDTDNVAGYVITATRVDGRKWYMAIDLSSGGYEYWSGIESARFYPDQAAAWADFTRRSGSDINTFLHRASGADFKTPERKVTLAVERVETNAVWSEEFKFALETRTQAVRPPTA